MGTARPPAPCTQQTAASSSAGRETEVWQPLLSSPRPFTAPPSRALSLLFPQPAGGGPGTKRNQDESPRTPVTPVARLPEPHSQALFIFLRRGRNSETLRHDFPNSAQGHTFSCLYQHHPGREGPGRENNPTRLPCLPSPLSCGGRLGPPGALTLTRIDPTHHRKQSDSRSVGF